MAHTMDTDYDLPIPTHRSCVRDDPQHDKPLPFRYQLQKVTRLTAENSTPFTLPKQRSQLESIPVELRRTIWGFLGLEGNNKPLQSGFGSTDWYGPASTNELFYGHDSAWHPDFTTSDGNEVLVFRKAMAINKNIRSELLDILFEGARVRIRHHLSDRKIFFRCRDAYDKPVLGRMIHACSTFEYLRHVYLGRCYDDYDEAPHSMRVCKTQVRRPIMRRADSIRFIADHCPLLVSLQIVVSPWPRDHRHGYETKRSIRFCELKPIVIALQCVTQKCPSLETLKAVTPIKPCSVPAVGTIYREGHAHEEVRGLDLTKTPIYLREELVEAWANTSLRKVIELGTNDRYLYGRLYDLWRAFSWGPGEGRWQWFRTNVLGEVEFEDVQSVS